MAYLDVGLMYSVICLIASIVAFSIASTVIVHYNANPAARPFGQMMIFCAIFSFAYAFEIMRGDLSWIMFWIKIQYLGLAFLPAGWLWLSVVYTDYKPLKTKRFQAILIGMSVLFLAAVWSNESHHLYYTALSTHDYGPIETIVRDIGILYELYIVWVVSCLLLTIGLYLRNYQKNTRHSKKRILIMLSSFIFVILHYIVYMMEVIPWGLDTAPLALVLSSIVLSYGIFRFGLLDLSPIAREMVFGTMQEGVIITDGDQIIVDYNAAAEKILPILSADNAIGKMISAVIPNPEIYSSTFSPMETKPLKIETAHGIEYYDIRQIPVMRASDQQLGITWFLKEITQEYLLMQQLKEYAEIDGLTGIWNRRKWIELAENEVQRCNRYRRPLALMIIDIDNFKTVNDTMGHAAGDRVLAEFAHFLQTQIRETDIFGRLGGEEFGMVLLESDTEDFTHIAERLQRAVSGHAMTHREQNFQITISAGVYVCEKGGIASLEEAMRKADAALYRAKDAGKNRVCVTVAKRNAPRTVDHA